MSDGALDATVASGAGSSSDGERMGALTEPGRKIGRFVVLEVLGQGAMGLVVAAYDADLDRKVALKLLRPGAEEAMGTERLLREARAMAKLAHPNVLAVHEVGTVGEQVFLAMEFAAGGTLRAWCAAEPRPWRAVLDRFVAAARGLDAAHQGGLVHRDFKPENVLLTAAGEVRVADFGLVGIRARPVAPSDSDGERPADDTPLDVTLTRTGALLGTPAYMAPEQFNRADVGPAADQFALCASLWEALYGTRPFPGRTYWELAAAVVGGNLAEPPADRDVPAWLREVLRRGLRSKPAERWPSVAALVEALERDPVAARRKRMRAIAAAAALAALGGAVVFGLTRGAATAADTRCKNLDARLAGVWDPDRAAAVRTAFLATDKSYAADTADRVTARLDDYTTQWVAARVDTCEATHTRGEQSEALLDLRMACLDQRLVEFDALVSLFAKQPSPDVLTKAADAASKLTSLDACDDTEALQSLVPPPTDPAVRQQVDALRVRLAEAKALEDTGRYSDGLPIAQDVVTRADPLSYPPLLAEALFRRALLERRTGDAKAAEPTLQRALGVAAEAHDDRLLLGIWSELIYVVGSELVRPDEASKLRIGAEAALRRAGSPPVAEAGLMSNLGSMLHSQGKFADSQDYFERAIAIRSALDPRHISVASYSSNLGVALIEQGKYDEAHRAYTRALSLREELLGPQHPDVAISLTNLGLLAATQGRYDEAQRLHERALQIREQALGPEHPLTAASLSALAASLLGQGHYDDARAKYQRALEIREKTIGPRHPALVPTLLGIASVYQSEQKYSEAQQIFERALAIRVEALGSDHADVAIAMNDLSNVVSAQGRYEEARQLEVRALEIAEKALGPDHPNVAAVLTSLADTLVKLRRPREAREPAERAVRIRESKAVPAKRLAVSRFVLAQTLVAPAERSRAIELARAAAAGFREAGLRGVSEVAEVEAWLAARGAKP